MIGVGQPLGRKRNFDWIESDLDLDSESRQLDSSLSGDLEIVGVLTSSENRTRVEDVRDWCEEFSPTSSAELVGNKNKISELDQFLRHSLTHPAPSILHLTGPSGCGKSTALRVLARELEMDVVEWNVPTTVMSSVAEPTIDYPAQYPEGQFKSFKRFLIQHNYAPLTKVSSPAVGETAGYISSKFTSQFYRNVTVLVYRVAMPIPFNRADCRFDCFDFYRLNCNRQIFIDFLFI